MIGLFLSKSLSLYLQRPSIYNYDESATLRLTLTRPSLTHLAVYGHQVDKSSGS